LEEDLGAGLAPAGLGAGALTTAAAMAAAPAAAPSAAFAAPEAVYSLWNVASLAMCTLLLMFCGMFMFDMLRNMWSWQETYSVNSSMMDAILSWFEK
jgi:hypothetical protein